MLILKKIWKFSKMIKDKWKLNSNKLNFEYYSENYTLKLFIYTQIIV